MKHLFGAMLKSKVCITHTQIMLNIIHFNVVCTNVLLCIRIHTSVGMSSTVLMKTNLITQENCMSCPYTAE